ncbi:hypothetical protein PsorP6_017833 [Peronosclerospora sorghi]|uniref:Uncharacterized protein n=1 Tax=Peronosclerospora sorghi TaxID=230839 RepID=A0ACC0WCK0_9STRA|nr:hypothetical protein PsorP6_017833 [Peronosclerospora sorghi]
MNLGYRCSFRSRKGAAPAAALSSCYILFLLLLRFLLIHVTRDFSVLAQLLLLQLALHTVASFHYRNSRRVHRLRFDSQRVALGAFNQLASLFITVQALRHFGVLVAFLLQHVGMLLQQFERRHNTKDRNDAFFMLLGFILVAGVEAAQYGALMHSLALLGAALGLHYVIPSSADTTEDGASPQRMISDAVAAFIAFVLAILTPNTNSQQVSNDQANADGSIMNTITWTLYLVMTTGSQFAANYFLNKMRSLSSANQAKAELVCVSMGMMLAVIVAVWDRHLFHAGLVALTCCPMLYVFSSRWRCIGAFYGDDTDNEVYLDTYRSNSVRSKSDMLSRVSHVFAVLWCRRASREMLIFLLVNVAFMFVEVGVALYTNSLGLMGDAGHMLFDNGALMIGLVASYISQLPPDPMFTYGYGRVEVLSGFLNSLLLLLVSVHLLSKAASRFMDPPEVTTDHLVLTSIAGLIVNLIGLFFFHDHVHGHSHSPGGDSKHASGQGHNHGNRCHQTHGGDASEGGANRGNSNMHGVYLHVLADTLGSVGVIISSVLIQLYQWHVVDSISSALISFLILGSTLPLLRDTALQLLQGAPKELEGKVNAALRDVQTMVPGVERIAQWNIWHHAGDINVATLHLEVAFSADEQRVLRHTKDIFRGYAQLDKYLSVQILKPHVIDFMGLNNVRIDRSGVIDECRTDPSPRYRHGNCINNDHGHNNGRSHGHSHGAESLVDTRSVFPLDHHAQPVATRKSAHDNSASDDSRYVLSTVLSPRSPCAHTQLLWAS